MSKCERIIAVFADAVRAGGGIHSAAEIAAMLREQPTPALTKLLNDCVSKGLLRRVVKGLFESRITPPDGATAIYQIIKKLRPGVISYISLESQLSHSGVISQLPIDRLTIVTKGRSGEFTTPYGVVEFTHTKKKLSHLASQLYFDPDITMYRASDQQALADLTDCNRNLAMLES
jgi:predicted transcriptional regulator of viral defense system